MMVHSYLQRHGCSSDAVTNIASTVLHDYCTVIPDAISTLQCLPQLSAHFTCNFITAVTALYSPYGVYIFSQYVFCKVATYLISLGENNVHWVPLMVELYWSESDVAWNG